MLRLINLRHRFPNRVRRTSEGLTARDARRQAARGGRTRHYTEPSSSVHQFIHYFLELKLELRIVFEPTFLSWRI